MDSKAAVTILSNTKGGIPPCHKKQWADFHTESIKHQFMQHRIDTSVAKQGGGSAHNAGRKP